LSLAYPKWIQGHHRPAGPIGDLVGLSVKSGSRTILWKRDPVELYVFHLVVPDGATRIEVGLDYLASPATSTATGATSARLAVLNWSDILLYPVGSRSDNLTFRARLKLPDGWKWASALPGSDLEADMVQFTAVSMTTLMDSPVLTGRFLRTIDLSPGSTPPHYLDIAADGSAALEVPPEAVGFLRSAVREAGALFGAAHYRQYNFLFALSDEVGEDGTEHHESSDNRCPERFFLDSRMWRTRMRLLVHEFSHSWNGKYRRPQGIATADPLIPMDDSLLWVYEGLTRYFEWLLASRSGVLSPEFSHGYLARLAAQVDHRDGRAWRSLEDTAVSAPFLYNEGEQWESFRRGIDFYDEGLLLWLEADTIIRTQTGGTRSLDDFSHAFFGGKAGGPELRPYTFDELTASLSAIAPYDWRGFFESRLTATGNTPGPLNGLKAAGWSLSYQELPNAFEAADDAWRHVVDSRYSIGLKLDEDGRITDVLLKSPAFESGLGPWMRVLAVDGQLWSADRLREAIRASSQQPLALLVENGNATFETVIRYHGGERYPVLSRSGGRDLLQVIVAPRAER
jgi:predicted metalloprotease with PDZ domain